MEHLEVPEGVRVAASADHHFGHRRMPELSRRPYPLLDAMNRDFIRRHNAVVGPNDWFFALGDMCMGDFDASLACAAELNGQKFIVPGDHERISSIMARKKSAAYIDRFRRRYEEAGFTVLPEEGITIDIGGVRFAMSHWPYTGDHTEHDRHVELRPADEGLPLLHGHVHNEWRIRGRMFNVGVDVNNFTPVTEEQILEFAKGIS